ncbi:hypothetical protein OBCHQ24_18725 [Oceanobacillus iheyensis]|nr:hypothetical protein OBCHQ24_18725 [Oceanobacillus iheyensis]
MNKKSFILAVVIGCITGMFLINPFLRFLGVPPLSPMLVNIFGERNPLVLIILLIIIVIIFYIAFKLFKNK